MNTDYLKEFVHLSGTLSFSETAAALHVSQPVLSRHMEALEKECGRKLLDRTSRPISLTPYGKILLECAFEIESSLDHAKRLMRKPPAQNPLVAGGLLGSNLIEQTLTHLIKHCDIAKEIPVVLYDPHRLSATRFAQSDLFEDLRQEKVDFLLIFLPESDERLQEFENVLVDRAHLDLWVNTDSPLAALESPHLSDLDAYTFMASRHDAYLECAKDLLSRAKISSRIKPVYWNAGDMLERAFDHNEFDLFTTNGYDSDYDIMSKRFNIVRLPLDDPEAYYPLFMLWRHNSSISIEPIARRLQESYTKQFGDR